MKNEKNTNQSKYPDQEFKKYLNQLASPNYQGGSWMLPENPTPLEKSKHEICREILLYQQESKLSDEELANRMELTLAEIEEILHYRIAFFTLDRLITYASKLFRSEPLTIGIIRDKEIYDKSKRI